MANCSTCPSKGSCGKDESSCGIVNNPHNHIKKVVAVMSGKGGVGKSSMTVLMAKAYASMGFTVGIMDADITGPSIPKAFGIEGRAQMCEWGLWRMRRHLATLSRKFCR